MVNINITQTPYEHESTGREITGYYLITGEKPPGEQTLGCFPVDYSNQYRLHREFHIAGFHILRRQPHLFQSQEEHFKQLSSMTTAPPHEGHLESEVT
jgi:hypothetical protein